VLIFDEATSALDPESEAIIQRNLTKIAEGRTVIIVSHRLSALANADAILMLDRGKVVDLGDHVELVSRCSAYRQLWNQQHHHLRQVAQ
jgi:ATP-binding cassette subfamily B protein